MRSKVSRAVLVIAAALLGFVVPAGTVTSALASPAPARPASPVHYSGNNVQVVAGGFVETGQALTGDPHVFGRVYLATNGRGVQYGDPSAGP